MLYIVVNIYYDYNIQQIYNNYNKGEINENKMETKQTIS